jgi:predicted phosphodiesterase
LTPSKDVPAFNIDELIPHPNEMVKTFNHPCRSETLTEEVRMPCHDIQRIGLMADSHGNIEAMRECIHNIQCRDVDMLIHLGDFFDSQSSQDTIGIIETIQKHQILTVKGNNDYQIENALKNGCLNHIPAPHRKIIQSFLSFIPMRILINNICFTHSLPYDSIRSFYEPIDTGNIDRAEMIFHDTDYSLIFSGHSHFPILFRNRAGKVSREAIDRNTPIMFHADERFIIIVGAVSEGECGVFDISQMKYERIRS